MSIRIPSPILSWFRFISPIGTSNFSILEFFKGRNSVLWLESMNATVLSTDEFIIGAKLKPTKYPGCAIASRTDSIQDLSYGVRDFQYDINHRRYPLIRESHERYYGGYDLFRRVEVRASHQKDRLKDSWLPCMNYTIPCQHLDGEKHEFAGAREAFGCCRSILEALNDLTET